MSYGDFYIRCEHKFLRNIFSNEQLATSPEISTLENYCITYQKSLNICIALQSVLVAHNDITDIDQFNQDRRDFLEIKCSGMIFEDLRNAETECQNRFSKFRLSI